VELDEPAAIHFRSYLDPQTGVAPLADELQSEHVLVFKPDTGTQGK
jgi:hypothetical protein